MERQGMPDPDKPRSGHTLGEDAAAIAPLVSTLGRLRGRARVLLLAAGVASVLGVVLAALVVLGGLDFILRTPAWLRMVVLATGIVALILAALRWIVPAWRFRPSLIEVALRLERSEEGRRAGLTGVLASGLELAYQPPESPLSRGMASHVVDAAKRAAASVRASSILNPTPARHGLALLAAAVALVAIVTVAAGPALVTTGAARILTPWSGAEWPKRTAVADATEASVHALGTALPLRAAVLRSDREPEQMRVAARYRLVTADGTESTRRVMLAWQGHAVALESGADGEVRQGQLYERLVEPTALAAASGIDAASITELEYWFETDDDRTRPRRIKLVQPPTVMSAKALIAVPDYVRLAEAPERERSAFVTGERELGGGNDQRAVVGPVLAGSRIDLVIELNKIVPAPDLTEAGQEASAAAIARVLPGLEVTDDLVTSFDGRRWRISWPARTSVRIGVEPVDEFGIGKLEEAAYSFDVVEDRPPSATILEPREDEAVLATAIIEIMGEGRDDVGVESIDLEQQLARPARGSAGAAAEATTERVVFVERDWSQRPESPLQATVAGRLDLSTLALQPRDEVWLTALVQDGYIGFEGERHEPVRSAARRLRIISEEELVDQIRAELGALRRIAMRLDEEQAQVQSIVREGEITGADARRQGALTQRIEQQRATIERLSERMERNQLRDEALAGLLEDLDSLFQGAAGDSNRAAARMEAAARDENEPTPLTPEQTESINRSQEEVRDQLGRMAEMLDRGEDTWVMSRTLQRLLQQQRDLQAQTERLGERTMGRRSQDLTPEERAELRRLQERQDQLADAARQALDNLEERARQMQDADPAQAAAMEQAAQRGRQQQVPQRMDEAGENLEQNQTSTASAQQQEAIEALEQMVEDMNDAQRQRDQALRRMLARLIQSLEKLVTDQTVEIERLADAIQTDAFDGLDSAMILINQNTLAVGETARSDRATATVAEPIDRAARAQSDAIGALRASPIRSDSAQQHEIESRRLLVEALEEARRLERDAQRRDQEQQRANLRRIYREALEEQVAIRGQTEPYHGRQVDRRDRMSLRGLGDRQETLRTSLDELRRDTEDIVDASVFAFAHERLDVATMVAGKKLRAGQVDRSVQRNHDSAVRILASLVEALRDLERDDEFRDENDSSGGGGGGGDGQPQPLLPPLAELRLLRGMQQEAAELTRALDEADDPSARDELPLLADLQQSLRERGVELMQKLQQPEPLRPEERAPGEDGGQQ